MQEGHSQRGGGSAPLQGVGLSRAPSAVQLMREDVLELVGHKPWEEGS